MHSYAYKFLMTNYCNKIDEIANNIIKYMSPE